MTFDDALAAFAATDGDLPVAAIEDVLAQWDTTGPRCLALLDGYVQGRDVSEQTERALFVVIHLLGEKREAAAFGPLCMLAADPERVDLVLGDALSQTLPGLSINMAADDPAPLQTLAEQADGSDLVRDAALMALAYLTRTKRLPAAEMHAFFTGLFATLQPRGTSLVWASLVMAVGMLGYADLTDRVKAAFTQGFVDESIMLMEHFREDLQTARQKPASVEGFAANGIEPFGSTVEALSALGEADEETREPYVNPLRNVGRNDPCPCGSGKKFKKCCLV